MLLPPVDIESIQTISAQPKAMHNHRLSGGAGIRMNTSSGPVFAVTEDDGATRFLSGDLAEREYVISPTGDSDPTAVVRTIGLKQEQDLDPELALTLALQLLESFRWRAAEGLEHDPESRRSYLLNALADPKQFLETVRTVEEEVEEQTETEEPVVEETVVEEPMTMDIVTDTEEKEDVQDV